MKKGYKRIAKKILEDAKGELDSPEEDASVRDWAAFVLKRYEEMRREDEQRDVKEEHLANWLVRELFFALDERSLNQLIDSVSSGGQREEHSHLDLDLGVGAEVLGRLISRGFSGKNKEYFVKALIDAKERREPPLSPYRKPSKRLCPNCDSAKFKKVASDSLGEGVVSKKVCLNCGYVHKIGEEESNQ